MFFFQWDHEDWKPPIVVGAYAVIGIVGIVYALLNTTDATTFLSRLADVGSALFLIALVSEGVMWNMVMALGQIRAARDRGREEGREEGRVEGRMEGRMEGREEERAAMIQALRDAGISEDDIQQAVNRREARSNGAGREQS